MTLIITEEALARVDFERREYAALRRERGYEKSYKKAADYLLLAAEPDRIYALEEIQVLFMMGGRS